MGNQVSELYSLIASSSCPIEYLPVEVLIHIFERVESINDLLRYRLVERKWNFIILNYVRIKNLTIDSTEPIPSKRTFFFFSFDSKETNRHLTISDIEFFQSSLIMQTVLSNLRRLSINCFSEHTPHCLLICSLSELIHLEQLEIGRLHSTPTTLNLPNLKTLLIEKLLILPANTYEDHPLEGPFRLVLNTPSLCAYKTSSDLAYCDFMFPESVRQLSLKFHTTQAYQFKRLEIYYLKIGEPSDVLEKLPCLTALHIRTPLAKGTVEDLLDAKERLERPNFRFFYCGVPIDTTRQLTKFITDKAGIVWPSLLDLNEPANFRLVLVNYSQLPEFMPFLTCVNYNRLVAFMTALDDLDDEIACFNPSFFRQFLNIREIHADKNVKEIARLLDFLKRCPNLRGLHLLNQDDFPQVEYNRMPENHPLLKAVSFTERTKADFDFLLRFFDLHSIVTSRGPNFQLVLQAFKKFRSLQSFCFKLESGEDIAICSSPLEHFITFAGKPKSSPRRLKFRDRLHLIRVLERCSKDFDHMDFFFEH